MMIIMVVIVAFALIAAPDVETLVAGSFRESRATGTRCTKRSRPGKRQMEQTSKLLALSGETERSG
jgi:hypothetical protein